jgi:uncharacterized DUF497 family protein
LHADDEFEWDDRKAAANVRKHGVQFEDARADFRDAFAIEFRDDRHDYGEDRFILIGMSRSDLLVVVYTERPQRYRIFSARRAEPNERRYYHDENG